MFKKNQMCKYNDWIIKDFYELVQLQIYISKGSAVTDFTGLGSCSFNSSFFRISFLELWKTALVDVFRKIKSGLFLET